LEDFDYAFAEGGLTAFKLGKPLKSESFIKFIGEDRYKAMVKFVLHYIADLDMPIKRWAFTKCGSNHQLTRF
jgi:phosphomannomutase